MADSGLGRGRGLLLLRALKQSQMMDSSSESSSPHTTPGQSPATSDPSSNATKAASSTLSTSGYQSSGGRGRALTKLLETLRPGGEGPTVVPASDVNPSPVLGVSRGAKLLEQLGLRRAAAASGKQVNVEEVTQKIAEAKLAPPVVKDYQEVKSSPPVVKKGHSGTPVNVTSNYIYLKFKENIVYEYDVRFEPDQDHRFLRFKLLNEHKRYFQEKTFDGTTLYVPHKLPDETQCLTSTNPNDNTKVLVFITYRRSRRLSEMIHIYNVLFKSIMKDLELVQFGRQHFNQHAAILIPQHRLQVWPGYVTAVNEYEGGLMLTLDSTHRVLRTESVLEFIKEMVHNQG